MPPPAVPPGFFRLLAIATGALAVSLFFHSPHLWLMFGPPAPGSPVWARGLQFMLQCEHPFRTDLHDAGLVWRLAPAVLGYALHLRGPAALAIPWAGLLVMLWLSARLAWRLTGDLRAAALCTTLIGTTAATLAVTGWLGINDAWYASALLVVAGLPQVGWLAAACLIGPWIDERFVLGLPLACHVHTMLHGRARLGRLLGLAGASLAIYLGVRLTNPLGLPAHLVTDYLSDSLGRFGEWLPWVSLGWFMSLRAAWLLVLGPLVWLIVQRRHPSALLLAALLFLPLAGITLVSADTSRAPTLLLPALFLGLAQMAQWKPAQLRPVLAGLLAANLLMPAMEVTYKFSGIINMLPIEIARMLRI
jgi:hypothetical protein